MLLAIRSGAFVVRVASSTSLSCTSTLTGSRSPVVASSPSARRRLFSSAAAAQQSVARTAQQDVANGFYADTTASRPSSSSHFSDNAFDDFGQDYTSHTSEWLSRPPESPFGPPVNPTTAHMSSSTSNSILDHSYGDYFASPLDSAAAALPHHPHTTYSSTTMYRESESSQPHISSQPMFDQFQSPTFNQFQSPAAQSYPVPQPRNLSVASEDFSTISDFGFSNFESLVPPRAKPAVSNSSTRSRPPVSRSHRDPRENSGGYKFSFKKRILSGDNTGEISSSRKLDISKFGEMQSASNERRTTFDYSSLPRTTETHTSSSFRHHRERRDRREASPLLEPQLQRQVREERMLLRQKAEKTALEEALKSQGVAVSQSTDSEEAVAAAKKKAERRAEKIERAKENAAVSVNLPLATTVRNLSQLFSKKVDEVVAALATLGYEKLRKPTHIVRQKIARAVADHFSIACVLESRAIEDAYPRNELGDQAKNRSPLVCVMGHVDHGKTTLIDCIRKSTLAAKEHGGITQKIGAFAVKSQSGAALTIFDTPGHEAFSMMRARGASLVDVVILVVAADDGVMPQTVESIRMVKAANVPFVVAITKCDLRDAKPDLVRHQLMEHGIYSEGDTGSDGIIIEEVSGKTGDGVEDLVSLVHMRGELEEPLAEFDGPAEAVVIESAVDKRNGILTNVLVRNGELKVGDSYVIGTEYGKVKQLRDQNNKPIQSALPSTPVSIIGTRELPDIGTTLLVVENDKKARQVSEYRKEKESRNSLKKQSFWESEDKFAEKAECKEFHTVLKADCKGSIEAVESFFSSLQAPNNEVSMSLVKSSIGAVTEGDVALAQSTGATIHAYNVKVTPQAKKLAKQNGVEIRENNVIFHLMDDVTDLMSANLAAVFESKFVGRALVKKTFRGGKLAGCVVSEGSLLSRDGTGFRVMRKGETVFEQEHAPFQSLQRFDKAVQEVAQGVECGVDVGGVIVEPGDVIECVERMKLERRVTTNIAEVCQTQWKSLFQSTHTRTHTVHSKAEVEAEAEAEAGATSSAASSSPHGEESENNIERAGEEENSTTTTTPPLSLEDKREALKKAGQEIAKAEARRRLSDILEEGSSKHYA